MAAQIISYICACECRVPAGKLKKFRDRRNGKDITRMVCPEHYLDEAYISGYVCKCADCGIEFENEKRMERCPEHHEINRKAVLRRNQNTYITSRKGQKAVKKARKKFKAKQRPESLEDPSRIHCGRRDECLDKYKNKPYVKYLPCKNCKDYVLQHGKNDPLVMRSEAA